MAKLSSSTVARIPDRELRARLAHTLSDITWEYSNDLAELMAPFDVTYLVRRAKAGSAELAVSMAKASHDTDFLDTLFAKDRRVTVRAAIGGNSRTSLETVKKALSSTRTNRLHLITDQLSEARMLELLQDSETRLLLLGYASPKATARLFTKLLGIPVNQWTLYLGDGLEAARALGYLPWRKLPSDLARELCLTFSFSATDKSVKIAHAREKLSHMAVADGNLEAALDVQKRNAWPELVHSIVAGVSKGHGTFQRWDELNIVEEKRGRLAELLLNSPAPLGESLLRYLLSSSDSGWARGHRVVRGGAMENAAVRALTESLANGWDTRHIRLGIEALYHGEPHEVANMLASCPQDYLEQVTHLGRGRASALSPARLAELLEATDLFPPLALNWLLNEISANAHRLPGDTIEKRTRALVKAAPVLVSSGNRTAFVSGCAGILTGEEHVRLLIEELAHGNLSLDAQAVLLNAAWWETAGEEHDALRRDILGHLEKDGQFWKDQIARPNQEPIMFYHAGADMDAWMTANAPRAMEYLDTLWGSICPSSGIYPWLAQLAPQHALHWDHEGGPWVEPITAYLNARLSSTQEWEIAIGLLPEWNSTAEKLADAARALARCES